MTLSFRPIFGREIFIFQSFTRFLLEGSSKPDIIETTLRVEFFTVTEQSDKPNIVETTLLG
jgi:hypothetical protein